MLRSALAAVALAMAFAQTSMSAAAAQPQGRPLPTEFNQVLLDRSLVALPKIAQLGKQRLGRTDEQAHMKPICSEAGFDSIDQCTSMVAYTGMLFGGFDPRSGTFRDPVTQARDTLAMIEANPAMPPEEKAKLTAPMRRLIASFPRNIPTAHLELMTANRDRIFEVLACAHRK